MTLFLIFSFFGDTLTSNNIPFGVMSCNISFIFECPIICKTVKYVYQLDTALGVYSVLISTDLVDSSLIGRYES